MILKKMLDWTIETKHNLFDGNSQEEAIQSMVEHFAENEEDPEEITEFYACESGEIVQQVSQREINRIQLKVEREVRNWIREAEMEYEGRGEIRYEYRANLI